MKSLDKLCLITVIMDTRERKTMEKKRENKEKEERSYQLLEY